MTVTPNDPLLAAARIVLIIAMASTVFGVAAFFIGFVAILATGPGFLEPAIGIALGPDGVRLILGILALLVASSALSFFFVRHLYRVVGSVGDGDPFIPVNASRFHAMGWLALSVDLLLLGVSVLTYQAQPHRGGGFEFNFAFGGLLLALVLFVIARVFREGTRMREELEGTV